MFDYLSYHLIYLNLSSLYVYILTAQVDETTSSL